MKKATKTLIVLVVIFIVFVAWAINGLVDFAKDNLLGFVAVVGAVVFGLVVLFYHLGKSKPSDS